MENPKSPYQFYLILLVLTMAFTACQDPAESNDEVLVINSMQLTVQALDPLSNQGIEELEAELLRIEGNVSRTILTDSNGKASFQVSSAGLYEVSLQAEGYSPHHLFGELGDQDALQISFVSSDTLTSQVFSALGITPDANKGIVVIGLDRPNLSPAVGTKAELFGNYEQAFTLGSFGPSVGKEITSGGGGFVSFANVDPGSIDVRVEPVEGETCAVFPKNESTRFSIPVYAGAVSIVAYTCQNEL